MIVKNTSAFSILDHTADLRIGVRGKSLTDLFENAGHALITLLCKVRSINESEEIKVSISGSDHEDLLVRWLSELLYVFVVEKLVINDFSIDSLSDLKITATLNISIFDPVVHEILREIKAVTYHEIQISEKKGIWKTNITFDL